MSFHETKDLGCGEVGMKIGNGPIRIDEAYIIKGKRTNRHPFSYKKMSKYACLGRGSSYLVRSRTQHILYSQVLFVNEITAKRRKNEKICVKTEANLQKSLKI